MTSKAHVKFDPMKLGVAVAVVRDFPGAREILQWDGLLSVKRYTPDEVSAAAESPGDWLHLEEDDARAIYEALADYFGHSGHDTRALRKDYDSERGRVDRLISHITGGAR